MTSAWLLQVRDVFSTFLKSVIDPLCGLFESHTKGPSTLVGGPRFLPVPGNTDFETYHLIGRILFKVRPMVDIRRHP